MIIKHLRKYDKDFKKCTKELQSLIEKQKALFQQNPNHNSLHNKHINCKFADNMYSLRVNKQYRIIYYKYTDYVDFFRIINHDIYDRLTKEC